MGTSQSSTGPAGGVSLVPPWADEPEDLDDEPPQQGDESPETDQPDDVDDDTGGDSDGDGPEGGPPPDPQAPPRRFTSTRTNLSSFATTGDTTRMRRAVRDYVTTGYGGPATMGRRLARTAITAQALNNALAGTAPGVFDRTMLTGRSANEIMDAVAEAIAPPDGTQDTEAARESVRDALTDLLDRYPNADLLNLNDDERAFAIEGFTASEVYHRFMLDVGKHLQDNAADFARAMELAEQVRGYIRQVVEGAFRRLADSGGTLTGTAVRSVVRRSLDDTFNVFADYTDRSDT